MASIVFVPENLTGCINPTLGLARKLTRRGHRVSYLCRPDLEDRIRAQGFHFAPLLEEIYPRGSFAQEKRDEAQGGGFLKRIVANARRRNELFARGGLARAAEPLAPDLFIVDSALAAHGVAAYATSVPTLCFYHQLTSVRDPVVPPLATTLVPREGAGYRLRNALAWRLSSLPRKAIRVYFDFNAELRKLARTLNVPVELIDFTGEFWPRVRLTEIVFCPREFEFPQRGAIPGVHYVEPSVDFDRDDGDFPWELIDEKKPLINCSMGTLGVYIFAPESRRLLQTLIEAVGMRPDWQGVITVGDQFTEGDFQVPKNVVLRQYFPQLPLLKRASLSVIHGGLNTVKESILYGVPLVLLPLFNDQPGNAARVAYHGLGEIAGPPRKRKVTPRLLLDRMEAVVEQPAYRERVQSMSKVFWSHEERAPAVDIVEQALARRS